MRILAYKHESATTGWYIYDINDEYVYFRYFDGNNLSRLCKSKIRHDKDYLMYFISHGKRLYIGTFIKPILEWNI